MGPVSAPIRPAVEVATAPGSQEPDGRTDRGRVSWFCADRGFGYVVAEDGTEVFMSFRDLPGSGFRWVRAGDAVSYVRDWDLHGPVARAVEVLDRA